jgi:hypothetical protein
VTAFVGLVEVDQFVLGPLRPAPRRLKTFAGEDGHSRGDRDVGWEVKIDLVFLIETRRGNRRVGQDLCQGRGTFSPLPGARGGVDQCCGRKVSMTTVTKTVTNANLDLRPRMQK